MRTFVIANENCVLGFSLVGVEGRVVHNATELERVLAAGLADRTIGLILVSSDVADFSRERIDTLKIESSSPLVVEIPAQTEDSTYPSLREFIQSAVGISLGGH